VVTRRAPGLSRETAKENDVRITDGKLLAEASRRRGGPAVSAGRLLPWPVIDNDWPEDGEWPEEGLGPPDTRRPEAIPILYRRVMLLGTDEWRTLLASATPAERVYLRKLRSTARAFAYATRRREERERAKAAEEKAEAAQQTPAEGKKKFRLVHEGHRELPEGEQQWTIHIGRMPPYLREEQRDE
jgi:hypothetical protein